MAQRHQELVTRVGNIKTIFFRLHIAAAETFEKNYLTHYDEQAGEIEHGGNGTAKRRPKFVDCFGAFILTVNSSSRDI